MKLEVQNSLIKDIKFSQTTQIIDHVFFLNKDEMIDELKKIQFVRDVKIDVAKPGDKTRIIPVKDCIEPRYRVDRPQGFPGVTTDSFQVGEGVTKVMKNVAVVTVGDIVGFQEGLIDMWGEGAKWTPFSKTLNVVVDISVEPGLDPHEHEYCARLVGLKASEYLALALKDAEVDECETFELPGPGIEQEDLKGLPRVIYVQMMIAQGLLHDVYIYGSDAKKILPVLLHPNEELDGAVISGNCVAACDKITTYQHQNNSVVKELYKEHGKSLNFIGQILVPELTTMDGKFKMGDYVVKLCRMLGAEGAVVSEEGYGNPDSDLVMIAKGLEDHKIQTVLITDECTGWLGDSQPLTDTKEEAKAVISTGNVSHLVHLEQADTVLGNIAAISNIAGGWEGSYSPTDGSITCELNAVIGSTSEIGYHNLTVRLH